MTFKIIHLTLRETTLARSADCLGRLAAQGFSHVCIGEMFASQGGLVVDHERSVAKRRSSHEVMKHLHSASDARGLVAGIDIELDRMSAQGSSARALAGVYAVTPGLNGLDPRQPAEALETAYLQSSGAARAVDWWAARLDALEGAGAGFFRLTGLPALPTGFLRHLTQARTGKAPMLAWTPGLDWSRHGELSGAGLAGVFASTCWWDGRAPWYAEEVETLRHVAPVIGVAVPPGSSSVSAALVGYRAMLAAATTDGLFASAGGSDGASSNQSPRLETATALADRLAAHRLQGGLRSLTGPAAPVTVLLRPDADPRQATRAVAILVNPDDRVRPSPALDALPPAAGAAFLPEGEPPETLQPYEIAVVEMAHSKPVRAVPPAKAAASRSVKRATQETPIVIESVTPSVPAASGIGTFAAKHIVGRPLAIEADIFADGHDLLAAEILWWAEDETERQVAGLVPLANDRWRASLVPGRIGRHFFSIEAWRDDYGSLAHGLELKHRAGVDVTVEIEEMALFLAELDDRELEGLAAKARRAEAAPAVALLVAAETKLKAAALAPRRFRAELGPFPVDVERPQAEFAAWYELFPRSLADEPGRHGTFDDVVAHLPRVRAMGFDVLYFPPIHPIGSAHRKGRNNSLTAGPDDVGSPYAIGGEGGGHDAIHPALGSPADFRRLVAAARTQGLEIALDFAIQCSLDHPWLREHPEWFRHRPDGSIKYAENPPKKYEDIVNVDFYGEGAVPGLWLALRDVVLHWADEGVRIFRVDNPHTKPLPFWKWMIAEVRGRHPDTIFLSEAFTRPKMMYRLAAVGFTQSYTYFTWRNHKQEIADYLGELTAPPVVDYFRPHFFVNTPDINPVFLQTSGRPGFLIRAVLAATLSGLWGVYSGFELCEAAALPGREEYLDSEKYEIRPRDFTAAGNIVAEITLLNRLRRAHPALHSHRGVTFYNASNDQVLLYGKRAPDSEDMILVAVSLDPHRPQESAFELPLWEWKLPDDGTLLVEDLVRGGRMPWQGKVQSLRLEPSTPFAIWRVFRDNGPDEVRQ